MCDMPQHQPVTPTMRRNNSSSTTIKTPIQRYFRWLSPNESAIAGSMSSTSDILDSDEDSNDMDFRDNAEEYHNENVSLLLGDTTMDREVDYKEPKRRQHCQRSGEYDPSSWWNHQWLPNGPYKIGAQMVLDINGVKLFKFLLVSIMSLLLIHYYAIVMNADRDETYGIREMVLFDGNHIALDLVVFFVVGRLYESSAVDSMGWIIPSLGSAIVQSLIASRANTLHHSITAYEIHCTWTWQFWAVILCGAFPCIVGLITLHLVHAAKQQVLLQKFLELLIAFLIFFAPYITSSFFHLHHWYYAWALGMHANAKDVWWSRLTMSTLFGIYLNGIAIFGRDPVMTCAVTLYQSQNQQCPYLGDENYTLDALSSLNEPNWHNCSAAAINSS